MVPLHSSGMNLGNEFDCRFDAAASIGLLKSWSLAALLPRKVERILDNPVTKIEGAGSRCDCRRRPGIDVEIENPTTANLRQALIDEVTNVSIFKI
ncbi:hypothetical protein [Nitrobacter vulgaris]|uniref:hypothetical protein n=1 Tax=Nitrobacter vulgaris TaxID=29421 RepID=UPI00286CBCBB|nr:hypothetical protein [Nitrobacter vulgaris]